MCDGTKSPISTEFSVYMVMLYGDEGQVKFVQVL